MSGYAVVFLVVQVISAITVICLVLLQHGKGADMGAAFGSGSAGSLFGSSGSANFLSRMTSTAVTVFFVTTLALAFLGSQGNTSGGSGSVFDGAAATTSNAPVTPEVPGALQVPTTQTAPESSQTQSVNQIPTN